MNMQLLRERFRLAPSCAWAAAPVKLREERRPRMLRKQSCMQDLGRKLFQRSRRVAPVLCLTLHWLLYLRRLKIPKDIIDRNIKRASEKGQEAYIEKFYEVYGYGGAGMIIQVLTDKVNRSVAAVREVAKEYGGKMADSGSIMFKFKRAHVVTVKVTDVVKDNLIAIALDSGSDDVLEPSVDEDDSEEDSESYFKIVSSVENYPALLTNLHNEGIPFETDGGFELIPLMPVEVDDEAMALNKELMSKLLELDDVDAVYTDQK